MADVNIKYGSTSIATMDDSGAKTLKTGGKYVASDISVEYTKSQGGGGEEEEWPYDSNLHLWVNISEGRLSPFLGLYINGEATIDWGDGNTDTVTGVSTSGRKATKHTYESCGQYHIVVTLIVGECQIGGGNNDGSYLFYIGVTGTQGSVYNRNRIYQACVDRLYIGSDFSLKSYACRYMHGLRSVYLDCADGSIPTYAFQDCYSLLDVELSENITTIGNYAFYNCYALAFVALSENLTKIETSAFSYCYGIGIIRFLSDVPPALANSVFGNIYTDCIIEIPRGSFDAYRVATNYPNPSTYVYREV